MVVLVVVVPVVGSGGYAFCGFSSMSLLLMGFSKHGC